MATFQYPRWILHGVTAFWVLLAGGAVPGGAHPPVWPVIGFAVYWEVKCFEGGNAEVVVVHVVLAVDCAGVVVAAPRKKNQGG